MTNILNDPLAKEHLLQSTGSRLAPLFTWHGKDVYPVFGAEGEDDDTGGAGEGSDGEDGEDEGDNGSSSSSAGTVSREEFEALRKQLSAADKNKSAAEKKLKEIEDSKKDELTKATERVTELEKAHEDDARELAQLRLQNAFLSANTGITWHDPGDALALAERKGYLSEVVKEDGTVDTGKLTAKLKEMAKASPHLVKSGKEEDAGASGGENKGSATGGKVGSKGSGGGKGTGPDLSRYSRHLNR